MKKITFLYVFFMSLSASADIEWNGTYRIEGVRVKNSELNEVKRNKNYILHHLVLNPKITAYDGLTIYGRFDILNSNQYPNSQVGQFFGSGVGDSTQAQNGDTNDILSDRQKSDFIAVNNLYLTYAHEFGLLTVGRAPLHFGLGMSYNSGAKAFDHWFDNRDLVAYKFVTGNISVTPMFAKVAENDIGFEDDINDYMVHLQYENPDSELKLGLMYRMRHAAKFGNTAPGTPVFGDNTISPQGQGRFKGEYWNLFFSRWITDSLKFGLEAATQKGTTSVSSSAGAVSLDGYGVAMELDWVPKEANWNFNLKAGIASGDDPSTPNVYEGFIFDRNYDVAFLLFNQPLGQYDLFRTAGIRKTNYQNIQDLPSSRVDEEAISNVMYFAPKVKYKWSGKFDTDLGLTYARLTSDPLVGVNVDKSVGFEVDISLNYKPYDNVQWINRIGILSPGAAFAAGGLYNKQTAYGLETKAAITF
ncbi:MAG: hypothetical protein H6623_09695 [Bdellovibrionaceae bacterium]|nr:hypothetical protein [Pseudobdellovibrionaceae bacterium]